ncbi:hypothetical protein EI94DRAFT_1702376 [Lactarius quietus]|nr:hypothetical protein EI94DRAFT_1702376 [Lactarius quietus]
MTVKNCTNPCQNQPHNNIYAGIENGTCQLQPLIAVPIASEILVRPVVAVIVPTFIGMVNCPQLNLPSFKVWDFGLLLDASTHQPTPGAKKLQAMLDNEVKIAKPLLKKKHLSLRWCIGDTHTS